MRCPVPMNNLSELKILCRIHILLGPDLPLIFIVKKARTFNAIPHCWYRQGRKTIYSLWMCTCWRQLMSMTSLWCDVSTYLMLWSALTVWDIQFPSLTPVSELSLYFGVSCVTHSCINQMRLVKYPWEQYIWTLFPLHRWWWWIITIWNQ